MALEIICSNASPIWHLGRIKEIRGITLPGTDRTVTTCLDIDILQQIYSDILIPTKVKEELLESRRCPDVAKKFIESYTKPLQVKNKSLVDYLLQKYMGGIMTQRNMGECETFALASEQGIKALLANDGAESMFDCEQMVGNCVKYISLVPFGEQCWQAGIATKDDFKNFLETLSALGHVPKRYDSYFQKYGVPLSS